LDELDALMDRMLELPVNATNEGSAAGETAAESSSVFDFSTIGFESYRTDDGDSASIDSPDAMQFTTSAAADAGPSPGSDAGQSRTPFVYHSPAAPTFPGAPIFHGSLTSSRELDDQEPPAPFWLWPVVGINRLYTAIMSRLGPPGRFFLGAGRTWLGWIGLITLAGALVWGILDWIHWAG
jgi:hypothetical protein